MKCSATEKNTIITNIADIIQNARKVLVESNRSIGFSSSDTRKIVLLCMLYLRCNLDDCYSHETCFSKVLEKIGLSNSDYNLGIGVDITEINIHDTVITLHAVMDYPNWKEFLNYSYESLEYDVDYYFSVKKNRGVRSSNYKKKGLGIYYTPDDVVSFMTSRCLQYITSIREFPSIIDCSVGSGIFMLSCIEYLEKKYNTIRDLDKSLQILHQCIWGIDISKAAIDCCKTVIAQYYIDHYDECPKILRRVLCEIDNSFIVGDATKLNEVIESSNMPDQFDCIIGNPPYVTIDRTSNLFISFVDNLINYSSDMSLSALILPLSVCFSKGNGFIELRNRIQNDKACWEFLNYDRSPDSLFGDQVKTRNTILFRHANRERTTIYTTTLQRWTSENRHRLFANIELCNISDTNISGMVPKISGASSAYVYEALHNGAGCLKDLLSAYEDTGALLVINGTAYNWLCAYDHFPPSTDEKGNPYYSGSAKKFFAPDEKTRDFCIALLSNRIAYWYWVAVGDGFHINTSFLSEFRINKEQFSTNQYDLLCQLGREYSKKIQKHPTTSYNAGKAIVNYSHWEAMDIVKQIEKTIIRSINLPHQFEKQIEEWYSKQVDCNRL